MMTIPCKMKVSAGATDGPTPTISDWLPAIDPEIDPNEQGGFQQGWVMPNMLIADLVYVTET